jgi:hypothetical protein
MKKYIYIVIDFISLTLFYFYFNDIKKLVTTKHEVLSTEKNYFKNLLEWKNKFKLC